VLCVAIFVKQICLHWSQEAVTFNQWDRKYGSVFQINTLLHPNKYDSNRHTTFHANTWFYQQFEKRTACCGVDIMVESDSCKVIYIWRARIQRIPKHYLCAAQYWNRSRITGGYESFSGILCIKHMIKQVIWTFHILILDSSWSTYGIRPQTNSSYWAFHGGWGSLSLYWAG